MFNGTISSMPQTFAVVAPQLNSQSSANLSAASKAAQPAASMLQSLPCQLLGQTSLVLTPVANGSTVTCAPLALTVANQVQNPGPERTVTQFSSFWLSTPPMNDNETTKMCFKCRLSASGFVPR